MSTQGWENHLPLAFLGVEEPILLLGEGYSYRWVVCGGDF